MKPSIETIINEFAVRGLEAQDHERFMRRVANALNGNQRECLFYGRITKFSLTNPNVISDIFGEAKHNFYYDWKRNSAKMTSYKLGLCNSGTAISVEFQYEYANEAGDVKHDSTSVTVGQDSQYIDAFEIEVD